MNATVIDAPTGNEFRFAPDQKGQVQWRPTGAWSAITPAGHWYTLDPDDPIDRDTLEWVFPLLVEVDSPASTIAAAEDLRRAGRDLFDVVVDAVRIPQLVDWLARKLDRA